MHRPGGAHWQHTRRAECVHEQGATDSDQLFRGVAGHRRPAGGRPCAAAPHQGRVDGHVAPGRALL